MDTNLFIDGDERVKAVCAHCPVQVECYNYAVRHDVMGVWGGTTDSERVRARMRDSLLDGEIVIVWGTLD